MASQGSGVAYYTSSKLSGIGPYNISDLNIGPIVSVLHEHGRRGLPSSSMFDVPKENPLRSVLVLKIFIVYCERKF